jgi:hypothetical protein
MSKFTHLTLLGGIFLGLPGLSVAQKNFSVMAGAQLHMAKARFADQGPVADRLQLLPSGYSTYLVGAIIELSPRYALQASVGLAGYGYRFNLQADEPGRQATQTFRRQASEYALVVRRQYRVPGKPGRSWFTDLGLDLQASDSEGIPTFQLRSAPPSGPGVQVSGTLLKGNPHRIGLRLGAGREWRIGPREFFSLQVAASCGLRDLQRYQLQTTAWQQSEALDPVEYRNVLANRSSFIGVQARYRFQWVNF